MGRAYRIKARLQNNRLWEAVLARWPGTRNQAEAADRLGVTPSMFGLVLNMRAWPFNERTGEWWGTARRIARRLRDTEEHLFDRDLYGRAPRPITIEADYPELVGGGLLALPAPAPDDAAFDAERRAVVGRALGVLSEHEEAVLRARFGLDGGGERTLREAGAEIGVGPERARQIEWKALRKLREPRLARRLRGFAEVVEVVEKRGRW
jgi:RNA polymerase sigma factor (sigma-70 family)